MRRRFVAGTSRVGGVRAPQEMWDRWLEAADGKPLNRWIVDALNDAADKKLAQEARAEDAKQVRERLRATMAGVCVHGFPAGVCLRPECKGVK